MNINLFIKLKVGSTSQFITFTMRWHFSYPFPLMIKIQCIMATKLKSLYLYWNAPKLMYFYIIIFYHIFNLSIKNLFVAIMIIELQINHGSSVVMFNLTNDTCSPFSLTNTIIMFEFWKRNYNETLWLELFI